MAPRDRSARRKPPGQLSLFDDVALPPDGAGAPKEEQHHGHRSTVDERPSGFGDDEALDYSDDPILEQSYRTLRAVNDAIHNRP